MQLELLSSVIGRLHHHGATEERLGSVRPLTTSSTPSPTATAPPGTDLASSSGVADAEKGMSFMLLFATSILLHYNCNDDVVNGAGEPRRVLLRHAPATAAAFLQHHLSCKSFFRNITSVAKVKTKAKLSSTSPMLQKFLLQHHPCCKGKDGCQI